MLNAAENSRRSLHDNWFWKIGRDDGFLNIPSTQTSEVNRIL